MSRPRSLASSFACPFAFAFAPAFALATLLALATLNAHAAQRTFVASFGADTNTAANCSVASPCRGFAAAQTVTDNNGEIIVLDSAGYGAVTVTKSIAIIAPTGVYGGISVFPGTDGVTIATPGVNVVLRGLSINGQGGNNGINMTAGDSLTVENCVISNLSQQGIKVNANTSVKIADSIIRQNGFYGILFQNGVKSAIMRTALSGHTEAGMRAEGSLDNTTTTADIADSTFDGNRIAVLAVAYGFGGTAVVRVSIRDGRVVRSRACALSAESNFSSIVRLAASNNIVSNNFAGICGTGTGLKVLASGNTVIDNEGAGLFSGVGTVFESTGNNVVRNNGTNLSGTINVIATQ